MKNTSPNRKHTNNEQTPNRQLENTPTIRNTFKYRKQKNKMKTIEHKTQNEKTTNKQQHNRKNKERMTYLLMYKEANHKQK